MPLSRRRFLQGVAAIGIGGASVLPSLGHGRQSPQQTVLRFPARGNLTLLHTTDTHAQLEPIYYREPDTNIGVGANRDQPPHITGQKFLAHYGIAPGTLEAYAYTCVDFLPLARQYGRLGGFAHLATLIKHVRAERPGKVLYLDSGDTLQGSAVSLWRQGEDMVQVLNQLECDAMTGHWEFTYGQDRLQELIGMMRFPFLAQNVHDSTWEEPVFQPYTVKTVNGLAVAIIGQAFPYTPIANPRRLIPDWSFGIKEENLQRIIDRLRQQKVDLVVLISHNGFDVDKKLAGRVRGIDVILGGHTHDGLPRPERVGDTLIIASGCYGKFLSRLDLEIRNRRITGYAYRLIPVLSDAIEPDADMERLIANLRRPYQKELEQEVAKSATLLYRRGNVDGPFDELICAALQEHYQVDFVLSPGFRWGRTVLPGPVTVEDVYSQTAISYANTYQGAMSGQRLKEVLEDIADNLFNPDPYRQQGGDMVRSAGLDFTIKVQAPAGKRIRDLTVAGRPVEWRKRYRFAGWASMQEQSGPPVYDIALRYLRQKGRIAPRRQAPRLS